MLTAFNSVVRNDINSDSAFAISIDVLVEFDLKICSTIFDAVEL